MELTPIVYPKLNKFDLTVKSVIDLKIKFNEVLNFRKHIGKRIYFVFESVLYSGKLFYEINSNNQKEYYIVDVPNLDYNTLSVNSAIEIYDTFSITKDNELATFQDIADYFIASGANFSAVNGLIYENYNFQSLPGLLTPFDKTKIASKSLLIKSNDLDFDNLWRKLTDFEIFSDSTDVSNELNFIIKDTNNYVLNATVSLVKNGTSVDIVYFKVNHCNIPSESPIFLKFTNLEFYTGQNFLRVEAKISDTHSKRQEVYFGINNFDSLKIPVSMITKSTVVKFVTDLTYITVDKNLVEINPKTITTNEKTIPVFDNDIVVNLSGSKTLGRYVTGDIIPAQGKTSEEVLNLIASEPIIPTLSLSSNTVIEFNQTAINNVLTFGYTIHSLGASVTSAILEFKRANALTWTTLTSNPVLNLFNHELTDTEFNANSFQYRYIVVDSLGATNHIEFEIIPEAYVPPSIIFNLEAQIVRLYETALKREVGNNGSNLSGSCSRNSNLVPILTSEWFVKTDDSGSYTTLATPYDLAETGGVVSPISHNVIYPNRYVHFKLVITDEFTTTFVEKTINFENLIFYGNSVDFVNTSVKVRNLPSKRFIDDSNVFILNTGNSDNIFTVAIPANKTLVSVIDLDSLNANLTSEYNITIFDVNDMQNGPSSYKVCMMVSAIPYSTNHRHQITIS